MGLELPTQVTDSKLLKWDPGRSAPNGCHLAVQQTTQVPIVARKKTEIGADLAFVGFYAVLLALSSQNRFILYHSY